MDKRKRIFAAGQQIFAERGYERATISEIVKAAGVAQGTFYLYYQSKKDLFIKIVQEFFEKLISAMEEQKRTHQNANPNDIYVRTTINEHFYRNILQVFHTQRKMAVIFLREAVRLDPEVELLHRTFRLQIKEMVVSSLDLAGEAGTIRQVNPDILASALIGMVEKIAEELLMTNEPLYDIDAIAHELAAFGSFGLYNRPECKEKI